MTDVRNPHVHHIAELSDDEIFAAHESGKLSVRTARPLKTQRDLSLCYTPGVARVCTAIAEKPELANRFTGVGHTVAIISDGTAVLGLGDIGPRASLPVMEGKAQLFDRFAGLNAIPIVLDETDTDRLVDVIKAIAPSFGAISTGHLRPRCFEVVTPHRGLDMPVMHDDQRGTACHRRAWPTPAASSGATWRTSRSSSPVPAPPVACAHSRRRRRHRHRHARLRGVIHSSATTSTRSSRNGGAHQPRGVTGGVVDAFTDADCFIALSPDPSEEALQVMAEKPILLLAPTGDRPRPAYRYGPVVATGRSNLPNRINNVLAFGYLPRCTGRRSHGHHRR